MRAADRCSLALTPCRRSVQETCTRKWSDYDEYLAPTHFNGKKEVTLTIREVTQDELYRQAEKRNVATPVLWFKETKKGLVLSRTNRNALAQAFGDDAAKCIGRKVVLKLTPMRVAGRDMEVIRVHVPQNCAWSSAGRQPDPRRPADSTARHRSPRRVGTQRTSKPNARGAARAAAGTGMEFITGQQGGAGAKRSAPARSTVGQSRDRPRDRLRMGLRDLEARPVPYCETDFGFWLFCACSPPYTVPAWPSGLNADPGARGRLSGRVCARAPTCHTPDSVGPVCPVNPPLTRCWPAPGSARRPE